MSSIALAIEKSEIRHDRRAALVASTIANVHRKKNQRRFRVEDFMPKYQLTSRAKPKQTTLDMLNIVKQIAARQNARRPT